MRLSVLAVCLPLSSRLNAQTKSANKEREKERNNMAQAFTACVETKPPNPEEEDKEEPNLSEKQSPVFGSHTAGLVGAEEPLPSLPVPTCALTEGGRREEGGERGGETKTGGGEGASSKTSQTHGSVR